MAAFGQSLKICKLRYLRKADILALRGIKARSAAAHRRAAPPARRFGCSMRFAWRFRASGWDKVLRLSGWIAAPRPVDAQLIFRDPKRALTRLSPHVKRKAAFGNRPKLCKLRTLRIADAPPRGGDLVRLGALL